MTNRHHGFTLIEIMIVIMLLAILAAIIVPRIVDAQDDARESALETDVQMMRRQILVYKPRPAESSRQTHRNMNQGQAEINHQLWHNLPRRD